MSLCARLLVLSVLLAACTSATVYEGARQGGKSHCLSLPPALYDDCMKQYKEDYRSYEHQRESILDEEPDSR